MHIAHLETGRHVYGGARQTLLLVRGLQARGVVSTLICAAGSDVAAEARRHKLAVRELPMTGGLDLRLRGRLKRLLRELAPDLVHVHSRRGADWHGGRAARRVGPPAILTRRVDSREPLLGWKCRPYARVVAISLAVRQQLEVAGVPVAKLSVIRSAVEPQLTEPTWSRARLAREFALDPHCLLVGCVAQLIPRKGHEALFAAWRQVIAACPQARLLLFGRGPLDAELRRRAQRLGIAGSVVFAGFRADLPAFLGRLDLLAHPATAEGLGVAVLEAQAAGVPVVAFRAGGVPEIIADQRTGYLVRTGDAEAFAIGLTDLLLHETRRRAFADAAWAWAAREFRVADMLDGYLTLYRQVLETPRR